MILSMPFDVGTDLILKCIDSINKERIYLEWLVQLPLQRFEKEYISFKEYYDKRTGKNISTKSDAEIIEIARETERYFNGDWII